MEGSPQSASTHSSVNEDTHRDQRSDPIRRIHACNKPIQPDNSYAFPNNGKTHSRSFQSFWFKDYNRLHYDGETDGAFCFVCVKALQNNALRDVPSHADTFVKGGYRNWKKAIGIDKKQKQKQTGFPAHEQSDIHKEAVTRCFLLHHLKHMGISLTRHQQFMQLSDRQSQAYRGSWDEEDGAEVKSNFYQLLMLRAEEDPEVSSESTLLKEPRQKRLWKSLKTL